MNTLIVNESNNAVAVVTMTSIEIAQLTGKEHKNVMRDIRVMYEELDSAEQLKTELLEKINNLGLVTKDPHYILDKKHAHCLVTGYSTKLRMAVLARLEQLEAELEKAKVQPFKLPNRIELAQMVIEAESQVARLEEINSDKTFGQMTLSSVVGGNRKHAREAALWLCNNGYMRENLGYKGKLMGYTPTEKGKDFIIPRSSDKCKNKAVMFTKGVFDVLPIRLIHKVTIH